MKPSKRMQKIEKDFINSIDEIKEASREIKMMKLKINKRQKSMMDDGFFMSALDVIDQCTPRLGLKSYNYLLKKGLIKKHMIAKATFLRLSGWGQTVEGIYVERRKK